jgi:hypothetical protein
LESTSDESVGFSFMPSTALRAKRGEPWEANVFLRRVASGPAKAGSGQRVARTTLTQVAPQLIFPLVQRDIFRELAGKLLESIHPLVTAGSPDRHEAATTLDVP